MATWGDEVERRAAVRGLRLVDVAKRAGLRATQLSQIAELSEITEEMFLRVTRALDMTPEDWNRPEPLRTKTTRELARLLRQNVTTE